MIFYGTVRELSDFLGGRNADLGLDRAALLLATVEFPELEIDPFLAILDSYAAELGERVDLHDDGPSFIATTNDYLFEELGFQGNSGDYYNPANSCLNEVLASRIGIPITLSVVYMEIARRLGRPVMGIGLPGHFVVRYDDGAFATYIDPFHNGIALEVNDCVELAKRVAGIDLAEHPGLLAPVSRRQILSRMINNLRGVYVQRQAHRKLITLLDLLIDAHPESAAEYKERGIAHARMQSAALARADFERYLILSPEAADREEIETHIGSMTRFMAGLN